MKTGFTLYLFFSMLFVFSGVSAEEPSKLPPETISYVSHKKFPIYEKEEEDLNRRIKRIENLLRLDTYEWLYSIGKDERLTLKINIRIDEKLSPRSPHTITIDPSKNSEYAQGIIVVSCLKPNIEFNDLNRVRISIRTPTDSVEFYCPYRKGSFSSRINSVDSIKKNYNTPIYIFKISDKREKIYFLEIKAVITKREKEPSS
jgi:hypothetical protein